ncbi:hypothetical protein KM043_017472 [Ampulex compressa]|nr:hypothetical protein KM043_017472 [Ampulex compressa]
MHRTVPRKHMHLCGHSGSLGCRCWARAKISRAQNVAPVRSLISSALLGLSKRSSWSDTLTAKSWTKSEILRNLDEPERLWVDDAFTSTSRKRFPRKVVLRGYAGYKVDNIKIPR